MSTLTAPNYQQCQEFIEKIKEKRFNKVKERQVRKLNNLINKKEGGITWHSSQISPAARAFPQVNNRQVTPANRALQAGRLTPRAQEDSVLSAISQAGNPQAPLADSTLPLAERAVSHAVSSQSSQAGNFQFSLGESTLPQSDISQAGTPQASPVDSTLSLAESELSQASSSQSSPEDSALQVESAVLPQAGSFQASPVDSTLSPAESELSQTSSLQSSLEDSTLQTGNAVLPQAVRHSARLRASQARHISQAGNSSRQAGSTPRVDSTVSQQDSTVPQAASPQARASKEARSFPNRHNTLHGSSPLEQPSPKWVINLSSKPLTPAQRSVLAKGPNFVVTPRHPPNLEYITAIEAACTNLSQQDAEELRADVNQVLRASHLPKCNLTKAQNLAIRELKKDRDHIVLTADKG